MRRFDRKRCGMVTVITFFPIIWPVIDYLLLVRQLVRE